MNIFTIRYRKKTIFGKHRKTLTLLIFVSIFWLSFITKLSASPSTIYFYNPESNINNFVLLKNQFDKYLSDYGKFVFQPFSDKQTFEKYMQKKDGIFLISSWHYQELKNIIPIEPVFVGMAKGKSKQRKILYAKEGVVKLNSLFGKSIATSGSVDYTRNILIQMFGLEKEDIINSLQILTVPKDIDALMAFGYGIVDAALSTEHTVLKLSKINPKLCRILTEMASIDTHLQIVAVSKQHGKSIEQLLLILEKMTDSNLGRKNLKLISLDGWKRINKTDRELLER